MSYRLRNVLIAVALAGFAALLVTYYVSNYKKSVQHQQATVPVLVAAKDIAVGTLGSAVAGNLSTRQVPRNTVVPGAISSGDQIRSLVVTQPIYAGEQVTTRRFGPLVQQGIAGMLKGSYRALQLSGDANQVLAGTIKQGDHVDFVGVVTLQATSGGTAIDFARIVVRDLEVLQAQAAATSGKFGSAPSQAVILRVTDAQSQKIALVYKKGDYWSLELRPGINSADSPNGVETGWSLFHDGISPAKLAGLFGTGSH
jgi:Flp pilus assembly protein CpaB